jgi:hypothetical protein
MIQLTRATQLCSLGHGCWYTGLHERFARVYVTRADGLRLDSAPMLPLWPTWQNDPTSWQLTIQLEGTLVCKRPTAETSLSSRSIALEPSLDWNERWIGRRVRSLVIDWEPGFGPTQPDALRGTINAVDLERLVSIADRIERNGSTVDSGPVLHELDAVLRGIGVRIDALDALPRYVESARTMNTATLISTLRSNLAAHPMWVDAVCASGRCERQLRRDVQALYDRLGLHIDGLRGIMSRQRVLSAVMLLSAKGATVGEVARSVGYSSSRALALALQRAGLPTASAISAVGRDD